MIKRKLKIHDWATRVSLSFFANILVDCWRIYVSSVEMIYSTIDRVAPFGRRPPSIDDDKEADLYWCKTGAPRCGISANLTHLKDENTRRKKIDLQFTRLLKRLFIKDNILLLHL
jgi:hypothetical protein